MSQDAEEFLPLSTPVFHILLALGGERLHGYGIMEAIRGKTGGEAEILPGTLYATLNRMLEDGLVEEVERPEGADARRKYYRVTELGRRVVSAESERLATLLQVVRAERFFGMERP